MLVGDIPGPFKPFSGKRGKGKASGKGKGKASVHTPIPADALQAQALTAEMQMMLDSVKASKANLAELARLEAEAKASLAAVEAEGRAKAEAAAAAAAQAAAAAASAPAQPAQPLSEAVSTDEDETFRHWAQYERCCAMQGREPNPAGFQRYRAAAAAASEAAAASSPAAIGGVPPVQQTATGHAAHYHYHGPTINLGRGFGSGGSPAQQRTQVQLLQAMLRGSPIHASGMVLPPNQRLNFTDPSSPAPRGSDHRGFF